MSAPTSMLRPLLTLGRPTALAASVALHAVAIAAGGHSVGENGDTNARRLELAETLDIDIERPPVVPSSEPRASVDAAATSVPSSHHHPYPVAPSHDAHPHDPSIVHAPLGAAPDAPAAAPALPAEAPADAPVHFVLPVGRAVVGASRVGPAGEEGTALTVDPVTTYDEAQVSLPARLLASAPVEYPAEARAAEIETDVTVDIVIDANGRVVEAQSTSNAGRGLDRAAVRAVRAYRFSPAIRHGRPVGVRMKWTVQFRLR